MQVIFYNHEGKLPNNRYGNLFMETDSNFIEILLRQVKFETAMGHFKFEHDIIAVIDFSFVIRILFKKNSFIRNQSCLSIIYSPNNCKIK